MRLSKARGNEFPAATESIPVAISRSRREKVQQAKPEGEQDKITLKLATELFQSQKLHREGARLEWVGFSSVRIHDLFGLPDEKSPTEPTKSKSD